MYINKSHGAAVRQYAAQNRSPQYAVFNPNCSDVCGDLHFLTFEKFWPRKVSQCFLFSWSRTCLNLLFFHINSFISYHIHIDKQNIYHLTYFDQVKELRGRTLCRRVFSSVTAWESCRVTRYRLYRGGGGITHTHTHTCELLAFRYSCDTFSW